MPDQQADNPTVPRRSRPGRRAAVGVAWSLAIVLVLAIATHRWWLAPLVARDLAAHSGRAVHFDSIRLGLTPQLRPVAVLRGVRIANAPWGDPAVPFAALDEVRFEFAWQRIDGRYVVSKLSLRGGEAHLETHPDGRRNWRLRQPDDRGPGHYWFDALEPHDASLTLRNPATGMVFRGAATAASGPPASGPAGAALTTRIAIDGSFRGVAYKADLLTGPELTFRDTGRWFPARGSAEVAGARLDVDGRAVDLFLGARIDADATLDGRSLAALRTFARRPAAAASSAQAEPGRAAQAAAATASAAAAATLLVPAATRPFHVHAQVHVEPHRYALDAMTATVGGTDLHGDVAWAQAAAEGQRPTLHVRLASDKTDVADLLWLAGHDATVARARAEAAPVVDDPFAAARSLDGDVAFEAAHLSFAAFHALQSMKLAAALSAGRLTVGTLDVGWAGGHSSGHAALDLRQPRAEATLELQTHGVRLQALLPEADEKKRVTGAVSATVSATVAGNDIAAWRDSVSGSASLTVRDGTISSFLDAALGLEAGKMVRTLLSGAEPLAMPCAAAALSMQNGRGRLRELVIDSANTRTTGSGTVDLRDASIDVVLTPQPKRPGIDLGRSIRVHGRLPKPERTLVDRVAQPSIGLCAPA